jgi:hypothetical protein
LRQLLRSNTGLKHISSKRSIFDSSSRQSEGVDHSLILKEVELISRKQNMGQLRKDSDDCSGVMGGNKSVTINEAVSKGLREDFEIKINSRAN